MPVTQLDEWERKVDTIVSCQSIMFRHPILPVPIFKIFSVTYVPSNDYRYINNEHWSKIRPVLDLVLNDTTILYDVDVEEVSALVSDVRRKTDALRDYINRFDYSIFDSIAPFIHKDVWLDRSLLEDAISSTIDSKNVTNYSAKANLHWATKDGGVLSSAALGGPTYTFAHARLDSIIIKPSLKNLVNKEKIEYEKRLRPGRKLPSSLVDSLDFKYYIAFTRCPDSLYTERDDFTGKIISKYGKDFSDTIYIETSPSMHTKLLSDFDFSQIRNGFYEREQILWDEFSEEQQAYYIIAEKAWGKKIANIVCRGEVRLGFDEEMCHFAFMRTPYESSITQTPVGRAECHNFYHEGVKMYFINNILVGLEWQGNRLFEPRNRY